MPPSGVVRPSSLVLMLFALACACSKESRTLGPEQPQTPLNGPSDPRVSFFENNAYQVAQGGRYFNWYGCSTCHGYGAPAKRDLRTDMRLHPRGFDRVYNEIAQHRQVATNYGNRIPTEQLWQITGYVRSLSTLKPELRRRQDLDESGEPTGANWSGPAR